MILLKTYRNYWVKFTSRPKIDSVCMVVSEKHFVKKLPKHEGTVLAVVYPSVDAMPGGNIDNDGKELMGLIFLLNKINPGDQDEENEISLFQDLQSTLMSLERQMKDDFQRRFEIFRKIDLEEDSIHIDPEYQVFGGYNGWSMSFKLNWHGE